MSSKKAAAGTISGEFVALAALMMSLVALSIDTMLPALPAIGDDLGAGSPNTNQFVISVLFLGMSAGQVIFGPLSDHTGRKPAIYVGFAVFIAGTILSLYAWNFQMMLAGRLLQGLGAAGPRVITIALVRDRFEGAAMARVMSFVMTVFILIPILAPTLGQLLLVLSGWRAIFGLFLILSVITIAWFAFRQPETLEKENRIPFSMDRITAATREIVSTRQCLVYTIATGLIFGAFLGYLNSSQQILQVQYGLGDRFPLFFGLLAVAFGVATIFNSSLVMRFSLHLLVRLALAGLAVLSLIFLAISAALDGNPPLWALMLYLSILFFSIGILFGNLNALAMEPLGHIAGIGASVIGSLSTFAALVIGTAIGQSYDGTVLPLVGGFFLLGAAALGVTQLQEPS
ncbi:Bcr/CflA family drug resistance efflux transporter [Prosthecochloris sp. GSB1]|uniref:multidrug effflux MFS transporter n=1 Tax=Prosthecochloris sp. GSB1 TaxID=281093 RepID=UPI000B8C7263|nr:multidrug effflux MFS transporter [Prosthecochloris sp. GSB1]ASQ89996.1 Bcr/CflA family drug resistance efflux transporter [Prosthecochloris sp. GSB1]